MNQTDYNDLLAEAIELAASAHRNQKDKGGQAYILHPLRVMLALAPDKQLMIAGILHDVVEDTPIALGDIYIQFGTTIGKVVDLVSRPGPHAPNRPTYREFIRKLKSNELARLVKLADLADNMSPARMAGMPENERGIMKRYKWAVEELKEI